MLNLAPKSVLAKNWYTTNDSNLSAALKERHILSHIISEDQQQSSKGLNGLESQLSQSLMWLLTKGFSSSTSSPLHGAPHDPAAGFPKSDYPRKRMRHQDGSFIAYL